jgi:hypothetical protein
LKKIKNITDACAKISKLENKSDTVYDRAVSDLFENEQDAREQMLNSFSMLNTLNAETPNLMILPFFFQGKTDEIIKIFKKGTGQEKSMVLDFCQRLDVANSGKYKQELK